MENHLPCKQNKLAGFNGSGILIMNHAETCVWPLVFKRIFNMLFPLAFDSTDINFSYLWYCSQSYISLFSLATS